jgi:hypothetical protein
MPQTKDHDKIKNWVTTYGGYPVQEKSAPDENESGTFGIHFPNTEVHADTYEEITWEQFFQRFEARHAAFEYEDFEDGDPADHFRIEFEDDGEEEISLNEI